MELAEIQELILGWELPYALEECAARDITAHVLVTAPPKTAHASANAADTTDDEPNYRVIAVRAGENGSVVLIVSAENW
ncbi:MAG TPA: hypothetical protein GXZ82_06175 [Firmicutes bacterium]|jgi:hypothetical protein|nr:hypothetical protein [Bacillota bacterium]